LPVVALAAQITVQTRLAAVVVLVVTDVPYQEKTVAAGHLPNLR
jgi:hypothetical protein